jgi:hypothetical protein
MQQGMVVPPEMHTGKLLCRHLQGPGDFLAGEIIAVDVEVGVVVLPVGVIVPAFEQIAFDVTPCGGPVFQVRRFATTLDIAAPDQDVGAD